MDGGVMLSRHGLARLGFSMKPEDGASGYRQTLITFNDGVDARAASRTLKIRSENDRTVTFPRPPGEVAKLAQVRGLPRLLALLLGALAVVALLHALVQTVQRRRVELGVLRAIGFTRRQVASTIGWQAAALALVGALIGLPTGIAVGRWLWTGVAQGLGVASRPDVALGLLLVVPVALAVAALVGAALGTIAARTPAAVALRAE
jgi:cell division protein FtsX